MEQEVGIDMERRTYVSEAHDISEAGEKILKQLERAGFRARQIEPSKEERSWTL